ncbi:hypothetical protein HMJ29_12950 [Hymenobacter taeanensis]|uniref:Uncharacterized protein n=1 Tax=Hymenobacter taeanensis TaxID=2735321 RepID=A0A6M6BIF4_9BACT|nr:MULTISPECIES: hypothetical protein [Hymenobacter]QJX47800.1 hypothetical protein HMJ29_12950 [Hymenobacter taeanensis]UOQ82712.1 hypothetical protein MUN83_08115 [Hymenobacter sp. 5414T-23]
MLSVTISHMIVFETRFLYPVSAVRLQEEEGILPAEFLQSIAALRPFLEKEKAYGEVYSTSVLSPRGRQLVIHYRKTYSSDAGFVVEILAAEVAKTLPIAQVA